MRLCNKPTLLPLVQLVKYQSSTPPVRHYKTARHFLAAQSKCHYTERVNILPTLLPVAQSVNSHVVQSDGICSSCHKNFYNMGSLTPELLRRFIEYQLDNPEHTARGFGFLRTLPLNEIRGLLRKQLLVVEKLVSTIPHSEHVIAVVDNANINNGNEVERKWCYQNRDKIMQVTEFIAPHIFSVKAYHGASNKTYAVKCKYFYKGLDDLYCIYLAILLPHMPRVFSRDTFTNYIARANEYEAASGEKGFGDNFQKMLSNVTSPRIPSGGRDGFYFSSSCYTSHHVIDNGISYCITSSRLDQRFKG